MHCGGICYQCSINLTKIFHKTDRPNHKKFVIANTCTTTERGLQINVINQTYISVCIAMYSLIFIAFILLIIIIN